MKKERKKIKNSFKITYGIELYGSVIIPAMTYASEIQVVSRSVHYGKIKFQNNK